jgi:hypothetical protein
MTAADRKRAAVKARRTVVATQTALARDTRAEVVRQLEEALQQIVATLALQAPDAQDWRLVELQREIRRALDEFARDANAAIGPALARAVDNGTALVDRPLVAGGFAIEAIAPRINLRALDAMRAFATDKIRSITLAAADRINTQLGLAVMGAQSIFGTTKAVQKILGESTRNRASVIVHTEIGRAFSAAAAARIEEVAARGIAVRKQWRRSGKIHSRPEHDALDGVVVDHDQPFWSHSPKDGKVALMYPRDPKAPPGQTVNCGCTLLPFVEGLDYSTPKRKPFTPEEMAANPFRADLADAVPINR